MLININKDRIVINKYVDDKEVYSTKIVDIIPEDINDYYYKYINGQLVRGEVIDKNRMNQDEINFDMYSRIASLELGM